MANTEETSKETNNSRSAGRAFHLYCAFAAQQELLWLGANLIQRQMNAGKKIGSLRDTREMAIVWNDLAQETAQDVAAATGRLLEYGSNTGSRVAANAERGYADLMRSFRGGIETSTEHASEATASAAATVKRAAERMSRPSMKKR
jgi:hypothetical protein